MNSARRRQRIRNLIERITGIQVYRSFGHSLYVDIKRVNYCPRVIFDVGANNGRVAGELSVEFPDAQIYCFEPASAIYTELACNMEKIQNVRCFRIAFGGEEMTRTLYLTDIPTDNSFIKPKKFISTEQAAIRTIDNFVTENYELFGIYNQQPEYLSRTRLRYADACFANDLVLHSK
jgi:FkbM family methyltransferase